MLLTALIAASPVVQVAASAEAMYSDIKVILEDKVTGKTDEQRLYYVQDVLQTVRYYKDNMQNQIISLHATVDHDKSATLVFGALSALCFGVSTGCACIENVDKVGFALLGTLSTGAAIFTFCKRNIDRYNFKNKINELTAVIAKLEAIEKPLREKLESVITLNA